MYADDTSISYSSRSVTDLTQVINTDLDSIRLWLEGNKLSLNVAKTQSMILGVQLRSLGQNNDTASPDFQINEDRIAFKSNVKYLGVQIDSQLSWEEHITVALSKISRGVGMLKYSKKFLSLETVQKMYSGIVEPHYILLLGLGLRRRYNPAKAPKDAESSCSYRYRQFL